MPRDQVEQNPFGGPCGLAHVGFIAVCSFWAQWGLSVGNPLWTCPQKKKNLCFFFFFTMSKTLVFFFYSFFLFTQQTCPFWARVGPLRAENLAHAGSPLWAPRPAWNVGHMWPPHCGARVGPEWDNSKCGLTVGWPFTAFGFTAMYCNATVQYVEQ